MEAADELARSSLKIHRRLGFETSHGFGSKKKQQRGPQVDGPIFPLTKPGFLGYPVFLTHSHWRDLHISPRFRCRPFKQEQLVEGGQVGRREETLKEVAGVKII